MDRAADLVLVADHRAASRPAAGFVRLARRRIRQLPERFARRPAPSRSAPPGSSTRTLPDAGRARDGREPLARAEAPGRRDEQPGLLLPRVGCPGPRGRARLLPGGLVRHRGPARPDAGAVRPRRLAGRRPHRGRSSRRSPKRLPRATVHRVPNLGRDLGPLVELAGAGGLRRLRRDAQGAHEAQPASHRRRRLAHGVARRRSCRRRTGSAASSSCCAATTPSGSSCRAGTSTARRHGAPTSPWSRRWPHESRSPSIPSTLRYPGRLDVLGTTLGSPPARRSSARARAFRARSRAMSTARPRTRWSASSECRAQASGLDVVDAADVSLAAPPSAAEADAPAEGARVLPAAVPSDPRERRLVGNGLHRLGQRRPAPDPSTTGTAQPVEPGELGRYDLSDTEVMRRQSSLATGVRRRRIRHVPLLVRRAASSSTRR